MSKKYLPGLDKALQATAKIDERTIQTIEQLNKLVERLNTADSFALDTETTGLHLPSLNLVGISIAFEEEDSFYIPVGHVSLDRQLPTHVVINALKEPLERKNKVIYFHHAKFDIGVLKKYGINIPMVITKEFRSIEDTMIMSYTIDVNEKKSLKYLNAKYCGFTMNTFASLFGSTKSKTFGEPPLDEDEDDDILDTIEGDMADDEHNLANVAVPTAALYARDDVKGTIKLFKYFMKRLIEEKTLTQYYYELKLVPCMVHIHENGVMIDEEKAKQKFIEAEAEIKRLDDEIKEKLLSNPKIRKRVEARRYTVTGIRKADRPKMELKELLNLGSNKLKQEILYQDLGLQDENTILTKAKKPSTGKWALGELIRKGKRPNASKNEIFGSEVCEKLALLIKKKKLVDAFFRPLAEKVYKGRIYGHFNPTATRTGRFSCIAKGTKVKVSNNGIPIDIPIEDIKIGDTVFTLDVSQATIVPIKVNWAGKTGHRDIIRIHWKSYKPEESGYLDVTPDHEIRMQNTDFKMACDLQPADIIVGFRSNKIVMEIEILDKSEDVYCLNIPITHNFFAGEINVKNCSGPNLQQMPRDTKDYSFREIFKVPEGYTWVSGDLSQIELRVAAFLSGDKNMREAYINGEDIHTKTTFLVYGIKPEDFPEGKNDKEFYTKRTISKTLNFSMLFGAAGPKLRNMLINDAGIDENSITIEDCEKVSKDWFAGYPGIRDFIKLTEMEVQENLFVKTILGRKRYLPEAVPPPKFGQKEKTDIKAREEWKFKNKKFRGALRIAVNTIVQGTAADIMKLIMIKVYEEIEKGTFDHEEKTCKMILTVHDEMDFECPNETAKNLGNFILKTTTDIGKLLKFDIPILSEVGLGINWSQAK